MELDGAVASSIIGSIAAFSLRVFVAVYGAAKADLNSIAYALREELRPRDVRPCDASNMSITITSSLPSSSSA